MLRNVHVSEASFWDGRVYIITMFMSVASRKIDQHSRTFLNTHTKKSATEHFHYPKIRRQKNGRLKRWHTQKKKKRIVVATSKLDMRTDSIGFLGAIQLVGSGSQFTRVWPNRTNKLIAKNENTETCVGFNKGNHDLPFF